MDGTASLQHTRNQNRGADIDPKTRWNFSVRFRAEKSKPRPMRPASASHALEITMPFSRSQDQPHTPTRGAPLAWPDAASSTSPHHPHGEAGGALVLAPWGWWNHCLVVPHPMSRASFSWHSGAPRRFRGRCHATWSRRISDGVSGLGRLASTQARVLCLGPAYWLLQPARHGLGVEGPKCSGVARMIWEI